MLQAMLKRRCPIWRMPRRGCWNLLVEINDFPLQHHLTTLCCLGPLSVVGKWRARQVLRRSV